ncbi:related to ankyrin [Fusarium torulosum]|uniref:Related to ankyrin n=1 Tax=Fusarium torulosum TaxID=33205 RepID=A0AAE8MLS0_9HYPO|nr:related to ankyrin [Fusarium torulosum]
MEVTGLAVGVAGLAGLFTSCLEAVNIAQSYQTFRIDSHVLNTRFKVAKALFEQWGLRVGIEQGRLLPHHHSGLDDKNTSARVMELLHIIIKILCDESNAPLHRTGVAGGRDSDQTYAGMPGSRRQRLFWAIRRKGMRMEEVEIFEKLVDQLDKLVPSRIKDIQQILARIEGENKAEIRRELHFWLDGSPNERYHDSLQKRLPGTCNWILYRPVFRRWLEAEFSAGPKLLWVHGPAGFGKTILCAQVVQNLSRTPDTPVAHFFFTSDLESRKDPYLALRSWISQIVSRHETAFELVRQRRELNLEPASTRATRADVITVFTQLLHAIPGCIFVADGLDECTYLDNSNTSAKKFLHDVTNAVVGTHARVLFVSRDEPEIRQALIKDAPESFAEYKIMPEDVRSDTAVFSRDIVNRKLPNKTDDVRSTLSETMTDRCQGQFLWLRLQEDSLRAGMNKKQLQHAIEDTPTGLNDLYDHNWTRITQLKEWEKKRAFALLRWTAFALRPLTVCEITEAVLIVESEDLLLEDLPDAVDDHYVNTEIVGLCGPLVEVRNDPSNPSAGQRTVHLPHFSVRQYLLYHLPMPGWILHNCHLQTSHERFQNTVLAKACLQYISLRQVWDGTLHDSPHFLGVTFRRYAATTWHQHVSSGLRNDTVILRLCMRFLSRDSPTWDSWRTFIDSKDPKLQGQDAETIPPGPLYYVVDMGLKDLAISFITEQNVNETSTLGRSPLGIACAKGLIEVVDLMLQNRADITVMHNNRWTPVFVASFTGHAEVVKLLLENKADITFVDNNGWTPVYVASSNGHVEVVKLLLEKKADITVTDNDGWTPVFVASFTGHAEVVKLLLENKADITVADNNGWIPVFVASFTGHAEVVKLLLENKADITVADNNGWTPVYVASSNGHVEVVKLLLEKKADITVTDNDGWTPVYGASSKGHVEVVVRLLLENKADITVADNNGWTPVYVASLKGHAKVVRLLLENKADITVADNDGWTPVFVASSKGHVEVVKLLLENKADITVTDNDGWTPVYMASLKGHVEVVRLLLENKADVTVASNNG